MIAPSESFSPDRKLVLASGSPRRQQLLKEAGLIFDIDVTNVTEMEPGSMPARELCVTNARLKACAGALRRPGDLVLGSDTIVVLGEKVFGKPDCLDTARSYLRELSGRAHEVMTAVSLVEGENSVDFVESAFVKFRQLDEDAITDYLERVEVLDKAGGYAAQEEGQRIIEEIEGDFHTVMGLPVARVLEELEKLHFPLPTPA